MKEFIVEKIRYFDEEIIGVENRTMAAFVMMAAAGVVVMGLFLGSSAMTFQGVAGSRESIINFEYPVEIRRVHVLAGQRVKKGDLLLELSQSGLNTQIRQVQAQIGKLRSERIVRDQLNRAVGNRVGELASDPLTTEIRELEDELAVLERQRKNLFVFSEADGIVGSVNFKRGERAPSFASLVTLSSEGPTFVQGFIHEKAHSEVKVGSRVSVASLANPGYAVKGRVVSVGSRIVEMPPRMGSPQLALPWGREIVVQIPQESRLLLGERVQISPAFSFLPNFIAQADESLVPGVEAQGASSVTVPAAVSDKMNFEPSGLVYLPDLKKYLVISDDTDNDSRPFLFLMSPAGEVSEQVLKIPGLPELVDMESISADGDWIYVMTSLSAKKKGEPKLERNLLVRMKRKGLELRDVQAVNLGAKLRESLSRSTIAVFQELAREGFERLESEAHFVKENALFVALKRPVLGDGASVVLKVDDVNSLFKGGEIQVDSWKVITFRAKDETHQVSDMVVRPEGIYFATTCHHDSCGGLWRQTGTQEPKLLKHFTGLSPEGIAFSEDGENTLMLTFDQGEDPAKYLPLSQRALGKD